MDRAIFPNGVLIDQTALNRVELTKIAEILRIRTDVSSNGIFSGGAIMVNAVSNTLIDVAAFSGFCPNGEFIESAATTYGIELSDYTVSTINYVCAVQTTASTQYKPHESDGTRQATAQSNTYRIRVFTEAEYTALLETDDNTDNNAKDRCLLLGKVTANGSGIPLTTGSIESPMEYNNVMYSDPTVLSNIVGVSILAVSADTPTGNGTVDFDSTGSPYTLQWTDPNSGVGAAQNITADGSYTLPGGTGTITVEVNFSQLTASTTQTQTVAIYNLYEQDIPRLTAHDWLHRNMLGTGVVSISNPHAISYNDLYGSSLSLLDEHQDVMHCNGIWRESSASIFDYSVTITTPICDVLNIVAPVSGDLYYINGERLTDLSNTSITFSVPTAEVAMYEIYVTDEETLSYNKKAYVAQPRNLSGVWVVDMSESYPNGTYTLSYINLAGTYFFAWGGGPATVITSSEPPKVIRCFAADGIKWVDLFVNTATGVTDDTLPVGSCSDTWVVTSSPSWDTAMPIYTMPYWYNSASATGEFGYPPYSGGTRKLVDKRIYGTLGQENLADSALDHTEYSPSREHLYSGKVYYGAEVNKSFDLGSIVGLSAELSGGIYYCRGKRLQADAESLIFNNNTTSFVYADYEGNVQILDLSSGSHTFAGDELKAATWILGNDSWKSNPEFVETYYSNDVRRPERGVLLWKVVTTGGNIDSITDISRVVSAYNSSAWTVGQRPQTCNAAFDNLYAAFLYATVLDTYLNTTKSKKININIIGEVEIDDALVQPSSVHVSGSYGVSQRILNNYAPTVPNPVWTVSEGATISDVQIYNGATSACVLFKLEDSVSLSKILYQSNSNEHAFINNNGATVDKVSITNCSGAFCGSFFVSSTCNNSVISNNYIEQSSTSTSTSLISISGENLVIRDNTLTSNLGGANYCNLISLTNATYTDIENNKLFIDQGGTTNSSHGIKIVSSIPSIPTCQYINIKNNEILQTTGSTSKIQKGILIDGCQDVDVSNNKISGMQVGVGLGSTSGSTTCKKISIHENTVTDSYHCGIVVKVKNGTFSAVEHINIYDNTIDNITYSDDAFVGAYYNFSNGIVVYVEDPANSGITNLRYVSIHDNVISDITHSRASGDTNGILVFTSMNNAQAILYEHIDISRNKISNFDGSTTGLKCGISKRLFGGLTNFVFSRNISIHNNVIFTIPQNNFSTHYGIMCTVVDATALPIVNEDDLSNYSILGNEVSVSGVDTTPLTYTYSSEGINVLCGISKSMIGSNNIKTNDIGIYGIFFSSKIDGNHVWSMKQGITLHENSAKNVISNCDISVWSHNDVASGVYVTSVKQLYIQNCVFLLSGDLTSRQIQTGSASIHLESSDDTDQFSIKGCIFNLDFDSLQTNGETYMIYLDNTFGTWSISDNVFFNGCVTIGTPVYSVPTPTNVHCIFIDQGDTTNDLTRGALVNNTAHTNNTNENSVYLQSGHFIKHNFDNLSSTISARGNHVTLAIPNADMENSECPRLIFTVLGIMATEYTYPDSGGDTVTVKTNTFERATALSLGNNYVQELEGW